MIIPDNVRGRFTENLIGGLSMHLVGSFPVRLAFHVFVVLVGVLILAGAVNTAIVGSNGVLNRVSEDGVLTDWFRHPHSRFGTTHRIINMVVSLEIITILASRGDVTFLGNLYAFGVNLEFCDEGHCGSGAALYASAGPRIPRAAQSGNFRRGNSDWPGADHFGSARDCGD